jgi:hypothetical protein
VTTSRLLQTIARGSANHLQPLERQERRDAIRSLRLQSDVSPNQPATLLVYEQAFPYRLTARFNTRWSRALSRLRAFSLDRKLATGWSPESHPLLAARAQVLVTPVERQKLAHLWADLIAQAGRPPGLRGPRAPINREGILDNESLIRTLLGLLVAPTPGQVRGIASLSSLLSDGAGPLYNRQCSKDLHAALLEATALLDWSADAGRKRD